MRGLLIACTLALMSFGAAAQAWVATDQTFGYVYQRNTSYTWDDSTWVYGSGNLFNMRILYNVDVLVHHTSADMQRGVVLFNDNTDDMMYFLNYVGSLQETTEGDRLWQIYDVDILEYELNAWDYLTSGKLAISAGIATLMFDGLRIDYTEVQ